jgi:hypothetical protein
MTAGALHQAEQTQPFGKTRVPRMAVRHRRILLAIDIGFADRHLGQLLAQRDLVGEGPIGVRVELVEARLCQREIGIVDEGFAPDLERQRHRIIVGAGDGIEQADIVRRDHIVEAFAVKRNKGVDLDQPLDPVRKTVGNTRDDHAAIAVADQPDITQSLGLDIFCDR